MSSQQLSTTGFFQAAHKGTGQVLGHSCPNCNYFCFKSHSMCVTLALEKFTVGLALQTQPKV